MDLFFYFFLFDALAHSPGLRYLVSSLPSHEELPKRAESEEMEPNATCSNSEMRTRSAHELWPTHCTAVQQWLPGCHPSTQTRSGTCVSHPPAARLEPGSTRIRQRPKPSPQPSDWGGSGGYLVRWSEEIPIVRATDQEGRLKNFNYLLAYLRLCIALQLDMLGFAA